MFNKTKKQSKFDEAIEKVIGDRDLEQAMLDVRGEADLNGFKEGMAKGTMITAVTLPIGWYLGTKIAKKMFTRA